jgi:alanyl-tRNA synthetase
VSDLFASAAFSADTVVSFPDGATAGESSVLHVVRDGDSPVVILAETPFHPVDHTWPDQPGDAGSLRSGSNEVRVAEAVMAAMSAEGDVVVGPLIPVKRGTEGWTWLVGHRLAVAETPAWLERGIMVRLEVDAARRAGLSRGHTACHLASLALDRVTADLWRKDPGTDALGSPNFEARANQSSRIHESGSVDEYRLGKSLRKAGFDTEALAATIAERQAHLNELLSSWVASTASSRIAVDGPTIVDRRRWHCELPEGEAIIPCGGTHVGSLGEFAEIRVSLDLSDPQLLVMTTVATPAVH